MMYYLLLMLLTQNMWKKNDYSIGFDLAKESENIVITKTFSKAFGLAGLRVGWAYCPKKLLKDWIY